mgnify:CR=1 FL=1|jgi:hypothetical protein
MTEVIKRKVSTYYKPTPTFWRKIGDGLLGISTFVTGLAITADYKELAIGSLIVGSIGKFLTNFFKDENYAQ